MNKKREIYSDLLKIFSIFLVILIHVIAGYRDYYFATNTRYYFFLTFIDSFTRVAVPIFFMITGTFMLPRKTEKYSFYLKKRLPKLLIPLLLASIFFYIYECNKSGINPTIIEFIPSFLNNSIKYHLWYMYVVIIVYLFIPYLQILVQKLDRKNIFNLIILIAILSNGFKTIYLLTNRYDYGILSAFVLTDIFTYINYVLMGYYFSTYKLDKKKKIVLGILSIICICMMPVADHFYVLDSRYDEMLVATSIFPIIPSIFVYVFAKDYFGKKKVSDIVQKIVSEISLCIVYVYLIHPYIIEKFENVLSKLWISKGFKQDILRIILVTILTCIVSFIISYLIFTIKGLIIKLIYEIKTKKK